jgi:hypothetical protein
VLEWIGWLATAISVSSYLFKRQVILRRIQALAALVWMSYGLVIHSLPIIAANLFVGFAAVYFIPTRRSVSGATAGVLEKAEQND